MDGEGGEHVEACFSFSSSPLEPSIVRAEEQTYSGENGKTETRQLLRRMSKRTADTENCVEDRDKMTKRLGFRVDFFSMACCICYRSFFVSISSELFFFHFFIFFF